MKGSIYTIGYAIPDAMEQIEVLMTKEDMRLIDIRWSPYSRRWTQFRKEALEAKYGHRYQHVSDLGNIAYKNKGKEPIKLANPERGKVYLVSYLEAGYSLLLLCACKDYEKCHRKVVYELLRQDQKEC